MKQIGVLSTAEVRKQNRNRVFRFLIALTEPISRQELAYALSMSLPTLNQNLTELSELGLLQATDSTGNTGGRRPKLISVVPDARFAVGVELTDRQIRIEALDLRQRELAFRSHNLPFQNTEAYGRELAALLERFLDSAGLPRERLLGVGLTMPGIISASGSSVEYAPTMDILTETPCQFLGSIPYPFFLDNDGSCGGFGEWWNRSVQENIAFLSLNSGVGGAILANGSLYDGNQHRPAEFGHMCIHPGGRLCDCGRRGCLEAYCSAARLSSDLGVTLDGFFEALEHGNDAYQTRWNEYLQDLAIGVSNIQTILDCDVIIGGTMSQYLPKYSHELKALLRKDDPARRQTNYLHFCSNHGKAICFGAATRYISEFIEKI